MLNRSFKPAKCKTALKLAVSRIKLLKNKREAQLKQLKRELAKLLESGQDQTARIQVEHFVREEKTIAAYELIEIYCELIAGRLPIIESQKNCPIDLKEAISGVIFASPRCVDIPELLDVRKHITAKYGKEFISAAVELRPKCGVNRLLVEKLSAKAPDGPIKIKILNAIAEEHNVRWEPKPFGENDVKSFDDLQIGSTKGEKASCEELSHIHAPPVHDEKGHPNLHTYSQHKEDDVPTTTNFYKHNASFAAEMAGGSGNRSTTSGRSSPEIKSSGTRSQEMNHRDPYSENKSSFHKGRQNWNMEFKDAASAAQAAAESAELASMAARAAAELSNHEKVTRQYSTESHSSSGDEVPQEFASHDDKNLSTESANVASGAAREYSIHGNKSRHFSIGSQSSFGSGLSDEVPQEYAFRDGKQFSADLVNSSFHSSNYGIHKETLDSTKQNNLVGEPDHNYRNSHENVVKHGHSASLASTSAFGDDIDNPFSYGSHVANRHPHNNSMEHENSKYFEDARMSRQSSKASYSEFVSPSDDIWEENRKMGNNIVADPLVTDEESAHRTNVKETSTYNKTAVLFDDSGPENGGFTFSIDDKYERQGFVTFDDSDSPGSESGEDLIKPKVATSYGHEYCGPSTKYGTIGSSSMNDEIKGLDSRLSPSSGGSDRKTDITGVFENIFAYDDLPRSQPSLEVLSFKDAPLPKPNLEPNRSSHEQAKAKVQHSSSFPETVKTDRSESSNLGGNTPTKEKASHVHPKLPDYDSLAAHFLSLRKGHQ